MNIDNDNILNLAKYYQQKKTTGTISNDDLKTLKELAKKNNINTIRAWGKFVNKHQIPYLNLHNEFKNDWISWGELLLDKTSSYIQSKNLFKNELVNKFKNPKEWIEYQCNIIENELQNKRDDNMNDDLLDKIIKIPNRPQEYYKGEWIDWNDFLCLDNLNKKFGLTKYTVTTGTSNADKNIKVLINADKEKVLGFKYGKWNDIIMKAEHYNEVKKYLDTYLGYEFILQARILTNENGLYNKCQIQCRLKNDNNNAKVLVVYPESKKFNYDSGSLKWDNHTNKEICMNKEVYIKNNNIVMILTEIINYMKEIVKNAKNNDKLDAKQHNVKPNVVLEPDAKPDVILEPDVKPNVVLEPDAKPDVILEQDVKQDVILEPDAKQDVILEPDAKQDVILEPDAKPDVILEPDAKPELRKRKVIYKGLRHVCVV